MASAEECGPRSLAVNRPARRVLVLTGGVVFIEVEGLRFRVEVEAVLAEIPQTEAAAHELAQIVVPPAVDHVRERMHVGNSEEGQLVESLVGELMVEVLENGLKKYGW